MKRLLPDTLATLQSSPNRGGRFAANLPDTLVIHFTAGASLASSVRSLCDPASRASAHLVVGRDATVVQLVEFDTIAWHAGVSRHGERIGLNNYSIGIEIDNAGRLIRNAAGEFTTWFGRPVPQDQAIAATHRNETQPGWWHAYTEAQIEKVFALSRLLASELNIRHVLGHEEIAPGRKSDPGPAFPLERLRAHVLGSGRDEQVAAGPEVPVKGVVTASLLNVRRQPLRDGELAGPPLPRATLVAVQRDHDGWLQIDSPVLGWVKRDFVRLLHDHGPAALTVPMQDDESLPDAAPAPADATARPRAAQIPTLT